MERIPGTNSTSKLRVFFIICLFIFLILSVYIYRPLVYALNINDYGLADSFASLNYSLAIIQIFLIYDFTNKNLKIYAISVGLILVELSQLVIGIGTYDFIDIVYILLSIPLALFIERCLYKNKKEPNSSSISLS